MYSLYARKVAWLINRPVGVAFFFVAVTCLLGPWWSVYIFDTDEAINLMKAALVAEGYPLYTEIWSDQPPVFTLILSVIYKIFGANVIAARIVVLGFSAMLLVFLFRIIQLQSGNLAAWFATLCLGLSPLYIGLSVSVLIGLPAVTFAMAAMHCLIRGVDLDKRWLFAVAGFLLALSLQTKLFTSFLMVPIGFWLFLCWYNRGRPGRIRNHMLVLLTVFILTFVMIGAVSGNLALDQLLSPHALASAYYDLQGPGLLWHYLGLKYVPLILFAMAGLVAGCVISPEKTVLPATWLLLSLLIFTNHNPLWYHHLILVLVPLAWLAGNVMTIFTRAMDRNRSFILISLVSGLFVIVMGVFVYTAPGLKDRFLADIPVTYSHGMDNLAKYATDGDWIYSDTPMDVYRAGLLVPPGIAVYSSKRLLTGNLNFDFQRQVLTGYEPSIVMLRRGLADDDLLAWISNRYCLTVVGDEDRHYLRKDLVNPSVCTVE